MFTSLMLMSDEDYGNLILDLTTNAQAYQGLTAVEEAIKLSEEVGLPYTCSMPSGVADLDANSDWDSSRC